MKVGSLFSGGGLGDFGFMAAGMDIIWQCEIDEYCQKILALRYPESKRYRDIKTLKGSELEPVDIITGGFPCQPFSVAGKQLGETDDRNLWPEMFRIIKEVKPRWVVAENVPGIIPLYLDTVLSDLGSEGYACWPVVFSSHSLGAWHKRDRLWIVAHSRCGESWKCSDTHQMRNRGNFQKRTTSKIVRPSVHGGKETVANALQQGLSQRNESGGTNEETGGIKSRREFERGDATPWTRYWETEPAVGRVANGIANRVDRLKCLGNGQTPCSTYVIAKWIIEIESRISSG